MLSDVRALGDGHNIADPAFDQFRAKVLEQDGVDGIEDLPVNFRGMVAEKNEVELTDLMNRYAEEKMAVEVYQSQHMQVFGWLSPVVANSYASQSLAGTGLNTYHRFLREAETLRFSFIDGLNKAHIGALSYADDINRNKDEAASSRARISSENWNVLQEFEFSPASTADRWQGAAHPFIMLLVWFAALTVAGLILAQRMKP